jgi:DNA/RNA-binding protein KIN17
MFVMSSSSIPNGIFIIDGQERYVNPEGDVESNKSERTSKASMVFQMCEKQCRDENGFKCHCMSESHQRQMQVLGQNPTRVVNGYSQEFEQTFLDLMRRSHRFSRVAATVVYNEYINDRLHVHMNSTKWATLTEFIKYLGKTGKCKVEEES